MWKRGRGCVRCSLRAGLSLCNLYFRDGKKQQDSEDTEPGLPHSAHGHQPRVGLELTADGTERQNAQGELWREIISGAKLGADGLEGPLRMASSQDRTATIALPAFTDTPARQQVP